MSRPRPVVVEALVEMRRNRGRTPIVGDFGVGARRAVDLGLAEEVGRFAELNLRGQDLADEAISLAATLKPRKIT